MAQESRSFVPAAGVDWLLPFYDPLQTLLRVSQSHDELIERATLEPGHRVLDVGCGTGTLAIRMKQAHPDIEVIAIDPDMKALAMAASKAQRSGVDIRFEQGFGDALPCPNSHFDRVVSSFMFHHLPTNARADMLVEVKRVLIPSGILLLLDFGGSHSQGGFIAKLLHAHEHVSANEGDGVPTLMEEAGLAAAEEVGGRGTAFGHVATWRAVAP